ncbi:MAG: DUF3078 domain-containing protein [Bacteroidetes bacterium]|nr:DUF3078 domain-containing protein [Bacteroidota bacterium]
MNFRNISKAAFIAAFLLLLSHITKAQDADVKKFVDTKKDFKTEDKGWLKGGFLSTNFTNVGLKNWAAGGQSSVAFSVIGSSFAIYKTKQMTWENYLDASWGTIRNGAAKYPDGTINKFYKNEDKLSLLSKYGRKITPKLNYTALLEFKSQFFPGYAPFDPATGTSGQHISNFIAPAYGMLSLGFDYKPSSFLSFYLSPVTGKFTIVNEQRLADLGAFGVKKAETDGNGNPIAGTGQKFRTEFGWYLSMMFNKDIIQNTNLKTRVDLFTNYKTLNKTDVNWETTINMKVNKYITASIYTQLIYDDDIDVTPETPMVNPRVQFKHVLGIGFSYMFGDRL